MSRETTGDGAQDWIYVCEDSVEGVLSGIYDAWASRHGHEHNRIEVCGLREDMNFRLFTEEVYVETSEEKSEKVLRSIYQKISAEAAGRVLRVLWSDAPDKGDTVYRFLIAGFREGARTINKLTEPCVMRMMEMVRNYGNELHLVIGFLRFHESENGSLFALYRPKNDILPGLMAHFSDRMSMENFVIIDEKRGKAGVHMAGQVWYVRELLAEELEVFRRMAQKGDDYQNMWKVFFKTTEITERHNDSSQKNHCPLWYRDYMVEFMGVDNLR